MRLLSAVVLLISAMTQTYALTCYDCDGYYAEECFNINTIEYNCTGAKYCETIFTIYHGITTDVHRGCGYEEKSGEGWHTNNYYSWSRSTFFKYCNKKDLCNNDPTSGLKPCTKECINGECDYILGVCACYSGYTGDICNTTNGLILAPKIQKCHQCNSDYDGEVCENEIIGEGSVCLNGENYCSISRVTVLDTNMIAVKNVTVRGCTDSLTLSNCDLSRIGYDETSILYSYLTHTCFETCDKDSCNQKLSVEVENDEPSEMYCVQCSNAHRNCDLDRTICPHGTKYCISTVAYLISERVELHNKGDPDYAILSVVRGCANESVIPECKEEQVIGANSMKKVTCTETCEKDGCNTGWPTRPKCVICDSQDGYKCLKNHAFPTSCDKPYQTYCYIQDQKMKITTGVTSGYARRFVRDCSYHNRGNYCTTTRIGDTKIESCSRTCTTDGCNVGGEGEIPLQTLLYVLLVALSANLLQNVN